jgi:hypothetical protein
MRLCRKGDWQKELMVNDPCEVMFSLLKEMMEEVCTERMVEEERAKRGTVFLQEKEKAALQQIVDDNDSEWRSSVSIYHTSHHIIYTT